jgi:predicted GNAT family acetyltransferase
MEAQLIVRKRQCWIHRINQPGEPSRIACIVVVGRDSGRVAAINKVFTHPDFRSMGCAERLVRRVCKV